MMVVTSSELIAAPGETRAMRRILFFSVLLLAGCQGVSGPRDRRGDLARPDNPALTIERSSYCPPVPIMKGVPERTTFYVRPLPGDELRPNGRGRVMVKLEMLISEDGQPLFVKMTDRSGLRELDDQITQEWQMRQFRPALVDGLPVRALFRTNGASPLW